MGTYLVFDVLDIHGMVSPWRMRITDQDAPEAVVTLAEALATAAFGAAKPSQGGVQNCRLEIDSLITPTAAQADSDVRQNWQMGIFGDTNGIFRQGLPARNDAIALYAPGSKVLANLASGAWPALGTVMFGGAIVVQNTKFGDDGTDFSTVIASVRGRKRPREGGSR